MLRESQSCGISWYSDRNGTMLISSIARKRTRKESRNYPTQFSHFTEEEIEAKRGEITHLWLCRKVETQIQTSSLIIQHSVLPHTDSDISSWTLVQYLGVPWLSAHWASSWLCYFHTLCFSHHTSIKRTTFIKKRCPLKNSLGTYIIISFSFHTTLNLFY